MGTPQTTARCTRMPGLQGPPCRMKRPGARVGGARGHMTSRLDGYVGRQLSRLYQTEHGIADEFRRVAERHAAEADVARICELLAQQCGALIDLLGPHLERYAGQDRKSTRLNSSHLGISYA